MNKPAVNKYDKIDLSDRVEQCASLIDGALGVLRDFFDSVPYPTPVPPEKERLFREMGSQQALIMFVLEACVAGLRHDAAAIMALPK